MSKTLWQEFLEEISDFTEAEKAEVLSYAEKIITGRREEAEAQFNVLKKQRIGV